MNYLAFFKKYFNLLFFILVVGCATAGGYGIFKLMGYLDLMGNGIREQITINKHLFSTPIFLLFVPAVLRMWRKGMQHKLTFSQNALAASIAIYISIFIIGGMASRTLFAKRAEFYGYTHCPGKNYVNGIEATSRANPGRPAYTVWMPKDGCAEVLPAAQPDHP